MARRNKINNTKEEVEESVEESVEEVEVEESVEETNNVKIQPIKKVRKIQTLQDFLF